MDTYPIGLEQKIPEYSWKIFATLKRSSVSGLHPASNGHYLHGLFRSSANLEHWRKVFIDYNGHLAYLLAALSVAAIE